MSQDRRPWTQAELDSLDRLLGKVSAATIANRLKRTETSVVTKIKALGHSRRVGGGYIGAAEDSRCSIERKVYLAL